VRVDHDARRPPWAARCKRAASESFPQSIIRGRKDTSKSRIAIDGFVRFGQAVREGRFFFRFEAVPASTRVRNLRFAFGGGWPGSPRRNSSG